MFKIEMEAKIYPNLQTMCRLCLKENAGTVCIFKDETSTDKNVALSIPMRIMTCAALEVHDSKDFPRKICSECRFQLEKSYYFRKLSQLSDAKLRKHVRLIGLGKTSKVFAKNLEEEDDDEFKFQDSLDFIKQHEEKQKEIEKLKLQSFISHMQLQNEQNQQQFREEVRKEIRDEINAELREELRNEVKEEVREELRTQVMEDARKEIRTEVQKNVEENLKKELTEQCISKAKESLRTEVREECRQLEIKCLLDDLENFLKNKRRNLNCVIPSKNVMDNISFISTDSPKSIRKSIELSPPQIEVVRMELQLQNINKEKENIILTENVIEEEILNTNDEEFDSEGNYLVYDTDEGFDGHKKSLDEKFVYVENDGQEDGYDDEYLESDVATFAKDSYENIDTNEESAETSKTTTSYRIEDTDNGEIHINNAVDGENIDNTNEDIMVINIAEEIENEYLEQIPEVKTVKAKKQPASKTKISSEKKGKSPSRATRATPSSETTILTKTYVNPMQRITDTPKIFKCEGCPMVFSTKFSLDRHLATHRKVDKSGVNFQCSQCRTVVSCASALRRHMFVHYKEKPFPCEVCGKAFVQKEILKRHMQTHTGIKPHQCPHCNRSYAQRINLKEHISRCHLEKPHIRQHSCCLCPKSFNHASGLSRHLITHSGVAFQCSQCDRTFADRSSVKRHILTIHGNSRDSKVVANQKTP